MTGESRSGGSEPLEDLPDRAFGVGDVIRLMRARANISARHLSNIAGLSPSYVSKVEAGEIDPSLRAFSRLAAALRMNSQEVWFCIQVSFTAMRDDRTDVRSEAL